MARAGFRRGTPCTGPRDTRRFACATGRATPHDFACDLTAALDGTRLSLSLSVRNMGLRALPFGLGWHPYFPRTMGTTLRLKASRRQDMDERGLPMPERAASTPRDFRHARLLPQQGLSVAYPAPDGFHLRRPDGFRVECRMSGARSCLLWSPVGSNVVCIEPMSHHVDAFRSADEALSHVLASNSVMGLRLSIRCCLRRWWRSRWRDLRQGALAVSRGEIDWLIGEGHGERLPAVDLADDDLPRGERRPDQHRRGPGLGQDGSRALIRRRSSSCGRSIASVVRADLRWPGGSRVKVRRRSPASSRLSATTSHVAPLVRATMANALRPPLARERLAAGLHAGGGLGAGHVAPGLGQLVMEPLRRVREQVAALVSRAPLDRDVGPHGTSDHGAASAASSPGAPSTTTRPGAFRPRRVMSSRKAVQAGAPSPPMVLSASRVFWPSRRTPTATSSERAVALRSILARTTVPSRIRRTMSSSPRSRAFRASQSVRTLRHARLTTALPTAPSNSAAKARRARRVLVPAGQAPAISASARSVSRRSRRSPFERHPAVPPSSRASRARGTLTVPAPDVPITCRSRRPWRHPRGPSSARSQRPRPSAASGPSSRIASMKARTRPRTPSSIGSLQSPGDGAGALVVVVSSMARSPRRQQPPVRVGPMPGDHANPKSPPRSRQHRGGRGPLSPDGVRRRAA